ncbi:hypothetical protein N7491_006300 [Penicillium cf. griseofulvum]|uniref:Uncharacterized protein n=1 Tax=Penicillium cf. griseofulvum TaxID=2972120 RepID=A0A9W9M1M3_9EURO|nr:hypothetical protein N7472_010670 [Penicillium cf. griseofulvum]KAJ5429284.1 hypothetical protein N7491_006300 [Penicillium cf. griseofulvum]
MASSVLDEHLDNFNLMEILKDEHDDLLPITPFVESEPEPAQTSEIGLTSQDATPFPEFVTPSDLGGVSNFESFYNEDGELENYISYGVSIINPLIQSPLTEKPDQPVDGRQVPDIFDGSVYREMHVGNLPDFGRLPRLSEQHASPARFDISPMVNEELSQPDGSSGQFMNQQS